MSSAPVRPSFASDAIASAVVAIFSMTVAVGFVRVFSGWPFLTDMAVIAVVGHGVGLVLRRLRLSPWIAVPATALALVWTVLAVYYAATFSWALPTSETWSMLQTELTSVREEFRTAIAPVEYAAGWNVLAAIGLATSVLLADVFAFRADARAETLVPGGVLFVFVGALGDERLRVASAVLLVGVGVVTTVALRWYHAEPGRNQVANTVRRWPVAIGFGVAVALAAGFVGPRLPGADAAPLYETSGGSSSATQVISPLVDIRSRLTNRSTAELFRMRADTESYWRSSALPEFDGTIWGLPERDLEPVDGTIGGPDTARSDNVQRITIGVLGGRLVPAALAEVIAATPSEDLRWDPETSRLVTVNGDLDTGDVIEIVSSAPVLDSATLAAATSTAFGDPIYTSVPDDLPTVVETTARQITAGAANVFEAARLTEDWFQDNFDYSTEIQPGHDNSAIERFLENRIGYCEQFAGTYAAMMRTLDIPSRVAVGFTSGIAQGDGEFSVIGRNAHAWPEVWFDGIGWVMFEPTPTRGAPNAESYTGRPPLQDTSASADDVDDGSLTPPTTLPTGPGFDDQGLEIPDFSDTSPTDGTSNGGTSSGAETTGGGVPWGWIGAVVLVAGVLAGPWLFRLARRRRDAHSVDLQVATAWRRATTAVAAAGVPVHGSDTPLEVAASTAHHFPVVTRPMSSLAEIVTQATYGPDGTAGFDSVRAYGASTISDCRNWAKQIDRAATESLDWQSRLRRYFTSLR